MTPLESSLWTLRGAIAPLIWTFTFLFLSLFSLSFPGLLNRWVAFSIILIPACATFMTSERLIPDAYAEETYMRFVLIFLAHTSSLLLLKKPHELHTTLTLNPSSQTRNPWVRGYKLLFNSRMIGTKEEVPYSRKTTLDSPAESRKDSKSDVTRREKRDQPLIYRSKRSGIVLRLLYLGLNFLLLCLYYEYLDLARHFQLSPADVSPSKESLIRRLLHISSTAITQRDLLVRVWSIANTIIPEYLVLSMYHDILAILFISLNLDASWDWPPLFGPITSAYTVRNYWGRFWHRLIYRSFSSYSATITRKLGLAHRSLATRLLQNLVVFGLSALMHGVVSWRLGNRCAWNRNLVYWVLQPMAFVLEGVVGAVWGKWGPKRRDGVVIKVLERVVGYVWVFAWLFWSVPKRMYPLMYCRA